MKKIYKLAGLMTVICVLFLGGQAAAPAQNVSVPRETSTGESKGPQTPSATRRILLNIARAVIEILCAETGDCPSTGNTKTETRTPGNGEEVRRLSPGFAGGDLRNLPRQRGFSFAPPAGWETYDERSSVTVAQPGEYVNGDLTNGVILGLLELNGASFEAGTETYVRELISNNKYLRRVGSPEGNAVDNIPCITTRMEGQSPKSRHVEKVVVYTCKRSMQKLFYVVTVNSGPHSNWYDEQNLRITQSISFRP